MKRLSASWVCMLLLAANAGAVSPGTDVWIPSVGHGPGQLGSQWRTDVWISQPLGNAVATVDLFFLPRGSTNTWPAESRRITINPGETREFVDIIRTLFNKDNAFGALRVMADREVLVTSRIYTVAGTATTGQFFAGLPAAAALAAGQTTDIQGVEESSAFRTNVGWVEVTGNPCSIQVQRVDGNGVVLASQTFNVQPYAVEQRGSILNQLGGPGANQRLRISVVSGTGKILAFGSRLDNASNDPSTIEMRTQTLVDRSRGTYGGFFASSGVVTGGLSFQLTSGGVLGFQATGMVDCGGVPYTLDLGPNQTAVALDSQNTFTLALTHDYFDGSTKVLTVAWTVSGTVTSSGTSTGALTGQVTFKASQAPWNSCVGLTQPWEAGWVKP